MFSLRPHHATSASLSGCHTRLCNSWLWQPATGFADGLPHRHTTRCLPSPVWLSTGRLRQVNSKAGASILRRPNRQNGVQCMTTDSSSESEDDFFLLAAVALNFEAVQANESRRHSNRRVSHFCLTFSVLVDLFRLYADWPDEHSTRKIRTCPNLCDKLSDPWRRATSICHTLWYLIARQHRSIDSIVWHRFYREFQAVNHYWFWYSFSQSEK